jgi:hypothetical protein
MKHSAAVVAPICASSMPIEVGGSSPSAGCGHVADAKPVAAALNALDVES